MIFSFGDIPLFLNKDDILKNNKVAVTHTSYSIPAESEQKLSSLHQHNFIEISYISSGSGIHRIWNESYPVSTGDLYVLNTAVAHGIFPHSSDEAISVHSLFFDPQDVFDTSIAQIGSENYLFGLFSHNNFALPLILSPKQIRETSNIFDAVYEESNNKTNGWEYAIYAHLTLLMLKIRRLADTLNHPQMYSETKAVSLGANLLSLIHEHYTDSSFSLKTASDILYKSTSTLSRSFFSLTGKHFSDYLSSYRIQQAASYIKDTQLSNEEIANLCGYNNPHSFYKHFRQFYGSTPSEFRKLTKQSSLHDTTTGNAENNQNLYAQISEKLQKCRRKDVIDLLTQALNMGLPPHEILHKGLVPGMNVIAQKYHSNEIYVVEVYSAAKIMNDSMELLKPHLTQNAEHYLGCAVICTVKGDLHDIGKNLVKLMLSSEGIQCIDLGVDVAPAAIVAAVKEHTPQLVCLSALLTTTMIVQKEVIDALKVNGLRDSVRVMVGGAPVTQEFADSIGADCYTPDAFTAAAEARRLLLEMKSQD